MNHFYSIDVKKLFSPIPFYLTNEFLVRWKKNLALVAYALFENTIFFTALMCRKYSYGRVVIDKQVTLTIQFIVKLEGKNLVLLQFITINQILGVI